MHRRWREILLTLPIAAMLATPWVARAAVHKCVDAQGKVTFTDQSCSAGSTQQQTNAPPTKNTDPGTTAAQPRASFNAALESRLQGLRAECSQGKQKACTQIQCAPALLDDARPSDFQQCSSAQGYKSTNTWAQMSEFKQRKPDEEETVSVTCLLHPEALELGKTRSLVYKTVKVTRYAFQQGFSAPGLQGAKFETWEQAADAACGK